MPEALATLQLSMSKWWKPPVETADDAGVEVEAPGGTDDTGDIGDTDVCGNDEMRDDDDPELAERGSNAAQDESNASTPSYEFRFECAKLLIEVDETTDTAIMVRTF